MIFENIVADALGARPLGESPISGRQPTTRLDTTVTKRRKVGISRSKVIKSGNLVEVYDYQIPIRYGFEQTHTKRKSTVIIRKEEYRSRTIYRAINHLKRLCSINFSENDKFLTLTFNDSHPIDINNLGECLPYYQKFIRRLKAKYTDLKFITVTEFQKRGAVHYHILCNIPFITKSELAKLWPYGFSKVKAVTSSTSLALYLSKYLSKRFEDKRKQGHRLYYSSRGLKKPQIIYGSNAEFISKQISHHKKFELKYTNQYDTDRNGLVTYKQHQREE